MTVMQLGLHRALRKTHQDFSLATLRSTGARAADRARLIVRWVATAITTQHQVQAPAPSASRPLTPYVGAVAAVVVVGIVLTALLAAVAVMNAPIRLLVAGPGLDGEVPADELRGMLGPLVRTFTANDIDPVASVLEWSSVSATGRPASRTSQIPRTPRAIAASIPNSRLQSWTHARSSENSQFEQKSRVAGVTRVGRNNTHYHSGSSNKRT